MDPSQLDPTTVRAISVGGLLVNGLILYGATTLWKKHKVWSSLLVMVGGAGLVANLSGAVSGRTMLQGTYR